MKGFALIASIYNSFIRCQSILRKTLQITKELRPRSLNLIIISKILFPNTLLKNK